MSETLKLQVDSVSGLPEWPAGHPMPAGNRSTLPSSPFNLVASPFNKESSDIDPAASALPLVKTLCNALSQAGISYCHWKSNWKLSRWLEGEGDLDLLVSVVDAHRFESVALGLGFVQAAKTGQVELPGIVHLYGWDADAERFVHLHVYHRLLVGHDLTNNYHLPIEELLLKSGNGAGLIPVPQAEFELIVFVVRKVLSSWVPEMILRRMSGRPADLQKTAHELDYLEAHTDPDKVQEILLQVCPGLTIALFERCRESLRLGSSIATRTFVRYQMEKALTAHALRHRHIDGVLKTWRFANRVFSEHILRRPSAKHSVNGGVLIALVGGDGSGKTTAVRGVRTWLDQAFDVKTFHFGKPHRSPITIAVIIAIRLRLMIKPVLQKLFPGRWEEYSPSHPGYLRMFRWVCAARDRHRVYRKARRFANKGGIAICDRYVVPRISLMDGPNIAQTLKGTELTWLSKLLLKAENRRYEQITQPDLLLILRVDPEIAVRRKTDEKEQHVRPRSQEIWETDWSGTRARVIDAGQSAAGVLANLRAQIWQQI